MKNLSSLTTFFVIFLLMIYLGVFTGLKVNTLISGKKLVAVSPLPPASIPAQPTSTPTSKPLTTLAEAPAAKGQVQAATSQTAPAPPAPTSATLPTATTPPSTAQAPPPVIDTSTPASVVDTPTPPPPESTPAPSVPPPSDRCIITLSGGQYDVTEFRNIHSGGDVFQCGTDMTAAFLSRHPASFLSKMSQYKV